VNGVRTPAGSGAGRRASAELTHVLRGLLAELMEVRHAALR
jgi:hypothetical protein